MLTTKMGAGDLHLHVGATGIGSIAYDRWLYDLKEIG